MLKSLYLPVIVFMSWHGMAKPASAVSAVSSCIKLSPYIGATNRCNPVRFSHNPMTNTDGVMTNTVALMTHTDDP